MPFSDKLKGALVHYQPLLFYLFITEKFPLTRFEPQLFGVRTKCSANQPCQCPNKVLFRISGLTSKGHSDNLVRISLRIQLLSLTTATVEALVSFLLGLVI